MVLRNLRRSLKETSAIGKIRSRLSDGPYEGLRQIKVLFITHGL